MQSASTSLGPAAMSGSANSAAVVAFEHAAVVLGHRTIWSHANFLLDAGQFVGLIGPNGTGKTTLLRVLLGQVPLAEGGVRVLGRPPGRGNPGIGYVPQRRSLTSDLAVRGYDLVLFGLVGGKWGFGPASAAERHAAAEALESVGASEYAGQPVGLLSGGEQQRLLIAQALLTNPRLLLLDEPLASLDLKSQHEIVQLVDTIRLERRMSVIFVAHDLNPLLDLLDGIVFIVDGRVISGALDDVVRSDLLSQLYGTDVHVYVSADGRRFVVGRRVAGSIRRANLECGPGCARHSQLRLHAECVRRRNDVAIMAGVVGYFVVLRRLAFATEALSHGGFAGATAAVVLQQDVFLGLLASTSFAGVLMGLLGDRLRGRDVAIGATLAFSLALGSLFLTVSTKLAGEASNILFGNILAISPSDVRFVMVFACACLLALGAMYRPLLFSSLDPEIAEARGLPVRVLGVTFMVLLGFAVATAVQVVGVLLIFALLILPAASAQQLSPRPAYAIGYAVVIAVLCVWLGLVIGFYLPFAPSFFITSLAFGGYLLTRRLGPTRLARGRQLARGGGVTGARSRARTTGQPTQHVVSTFGVCSTQPRKAPNTDDGFV